MKIYVENHLEGKGQEPFPKGHCYETVGFQLQGKCEDIRKLQEG